MKQISKKLLSVLMSALVLTGIFLPAVSAAAADTLIFTDLDLISDGEVSDTGYLSQKWVDGNGEEVQRSEYSYSFSKSRAALPSYYSSLDEGYVTSVKDQKGTSACWAFSSVAAAEISLIKGGFVSAESDLSDLSESHLVWFTHKSLTSDENDPTYGDGTNVTNPYLAGGHWLRSTYTLARGSGFAYEKDFPYYASNVSQMSNLKETDRYVSEYTVEKVFLIPDEDMTSIKKAILSEGSVMGAAYIAGDYFHRGSEGFAYYQNTTGVTNHEMTVIGWDDNFAVSNFRSDIKPTSPGAWLVKNSYGTSFADNGYFWISYEDPSLTQFVLQKAVPTESDENIYQYDGYGYSKAKGARTLSGTAIQTASQANVFTAERNENINAVSFYTYQPNVSYKIEIYSGVTPNKSTPIYAGTKADTVTTGTLDFEGYYKIPLERSFSVEAGESFSVVITFTSNNENEVMYLAYEGQSGQNDGVYERFYSSNSGESYYKYGDSAWNESSADSELNNACIKAFTTPDNSLEIRTAEEFNAFALSVANGTSYEGKNVNLINDIDFGGGKITLVGNEENPFKGHFLGNANVLKNGVVESDGDYVGIFSKISKTAEINRLGAENITVRGANGVGIICGQNDGKIQYCYSIGSSSGETCVGGIAGINKGIVSYSYSLSDISGTSNAGLLVGADIYGTYENCLVSSSSESAAIGNASDENVTYAQEADFSTGKAAFILDDGNLSRKSVWTKREGITTFMKSKDEAVYRVELYAPADYSSLFLYVTCNDNLKALANAAKSGYSAEIYSDSKCNQLFSGTITANMMLYVSWTQLPEPACEHKNVESVPEIAAGCLSTGSKAHYICKDCSFIYWDAKCTSLIVSESELLIPATGHTNGEWIENKKASCEEKGEQSLYCASCNELLETREISALGHKGSTWVESKAASCEESGEEKLCCDVCTAVMQTRSVSPLGHLLPDKSEWIESETEENLYIGTCMRNCGFVDTYKKINKVTEIKLSDTQKEVDYIKNAVNFTLTAEISPEEMTDDVEIIWSSSDESIATVDEKGNVTTHKKGEVTITATVINEDSSKCTAKCRVTVNYTVGQWLIFIFLLGFLWYFV